MSKKGTTWSKHKYIRIENGRYIYKENSAKESKQIDNALKTYNGTIQSLNPNLIKGMSRTAIKGLAASLISKNKTLLKNFKLGKGKSGSSSSSKSSGSKASSEKKGSSSKEKTSKESTSSKSVETKEKEVVDIPKVTVDTEYTKRLEEFVNKDRSKLPIIYKWAENELKKQKIKHYDSESPYMVGGKIFTSTDNVVPLNEVYGEIDEKPDFYSLEHSAKGTTWFKKDAKYIKRVKGKNGKWIYYYNQIKKFVKESVDKVKTLYKNIYNKVKNRKLKDIEVTNKERKAIIDSIKKENASFSLTEVTKQFKYYKKVQLPNGKWRYFYSEDEYKRYSQRNKYLDKDYDFMQDVPGTNKPLTPRQAARNADVGTDAGNCSSCSVAFELLMRGYDVQSRPDIDGRTSDEILNAFGIEKYTAENNWYLDTSKKENKNYYSKGLKKTSEEDRLQMAQDDLERTIIDRGGENQRGFMRISWTQTDPDENGNRSRSGGGHVFNYVVEDGDVKFYDAQKGESNNQRGGEIDIKEYLDNTDYITHRSLSDGNSYATYCGFYRVDNLDLSENVKNFIQYTPEEVHTSPEEIKDTGSLYRKGYPSTLADYHTKRK